MKRICLNCGSSPGFDPVYIAMAQRLGQALVARNYELVYGGADVGLMGQVADTVLNAGGVVIGVIPRSFAHKVSHQGLTELHVVDSMHEWMGILIGCCRFWTTLFRRASCGKNTGRCSLFQIRRRICSSALRPTAHRKLKNGWELR